MSELITGTSDNDAKLEGPNSKNAFVRGISTCRNWIGRDEDYAAEPARYHLIVGVNCPWCHRVMLARTMLGLQASVTMDVCFPSRSDETDEKGRTGTWQYVPEGQICRHGRHISFPECTADTIGGGKKTVVEIYDDHGVEQRSVPILFDKKTNTIVSNESADIVRMLSLHATALGTTYTPVPDLYPEHLRDSVNEANDWIYHTINNGAYKAGFSGSQDVYELAYANYFASFDRLNELLKTQPFVAGDVVTEADLRLFPTLFRHDPVYHSRFKLSKAYLWEYPFVWAWIGRMISQVPGVAECATKSLLQHCKQGYYGRTGSNTIPIGPEGYPECYTDPSYGSSKFKRLEA